MKRLALLVASFAGAAACSPTAKDYAGHWDCIGSVQVLGVDGGVVRDQPYQPGAEGKDGQLWDLGSDGDLLVHMIGSDGQSFVYHFKVDGFTASMRDATAQLAAVFGGHVASASSTITLAHDKTGADRAVDIKLESGGAVVQRTSCRRR